jgi:hypothetical protein
MLLASWYSYCSTFLLLQQNIIRGNVNARNSWFSAIIQWIDWYCIVLDTLINIKYMESVES